MLNLLPENQKEHIVSQYRWRVASVVVVVVGVISMLVVGIALLVPTFVYTRIIGSQIATEKAHEEHVAENEGRIQMVKGFEESKIFIETLYPSSKERVTVSNLMKTVGDVSPSSIEITGYDYSIELSEKKEEQIKLKIEGIASTRQALFTFQAGLEKILEFSQVELPVSNFAGNSDIDFVLTITVKPEET